MQNTMRNTFRTIAAALITLLACVQATAHAAPAYSTLRGSFSGFMEGSTPGAYPGEQIPISGPASGEFAIGALIYPEQDLSSPGRHVYIEPIFSMTLTFAGETRFLDRRWDLTPYATVAYSPGGQSVEVRGQGAPYSFFHLVLNAPPGGLFSEAFDERNEVIFNLAPEATGEMRFALGNRSYFGGSMVFSDLQFERSAAVPLPTSLLLAGVAGGLMWRQRRRAGPVG